ncbi:MAG: amino acid adenylation domain-containing protein [Defluviitaleaceae bacterium]|nr:amino acid adenylation domain-containing protein [Defluviitaleaceae bacterium]
MTNVLQYLEKTMTHIPNPDKPAFIGETGSMTFRQLYHQSRAIGTFLADRGVRQQPIAVFMEKSPDMIAAFLGVAYGGNYYVPVDAEMPPVRIQLILETVNPPLIICDETTQPLVEKWGLPYATQLFSGINQHPISDNTLAQIRAQAIDADPLYVVFTSGSTGIPKGVIACHRSVIDYIDSLSGVLQVGPDTVFGNQSPLYLDACLKEIYPTLKYGASAYLIPKSLFMFPVRLIEYINDNRINTICWVASALGLVAGLGALDKFTPHTLHTVAFGSEVFPIKHFNRWREALPQARFIHLYGPTEATGMSTYYEADRTFGPDESIPIGQPFVNTEIILLDDNDARPPQGEPGEICIRGTCLSLGYFGDTQRTQAAFVQNPLSPFPDIIYKTGDMGYIGPDSRLYFIARKDHQIKHMGHRIELAEIEWVASRCKDIQMACAVFDSDASRIILYYMPQNDATKAEVMTELKTNLPRYMVPHAIFPIENLPLTAGGKFDRLSLLEKYLENKKGK